MRDAFKAAMLTAALSTAGLAYAKAYAASSMDDYVWEKRPLILFAPDETHAIRAAQSSALENQSDALRERDMVFIEVIGQTTHIDGHAAPELHADTLRRRYGVAAGDAVALLVGKDGGVKLRQTRAIEASTLFETIDAMPMRRHEIRTRAENNE